MSLRTLFPENKSEVKHSNIVLCNIIAIYTEMTKTYDDMTGLRQLLYILRQKKSHLTTSLKLGVMSLTYCCSQTIKDRALNLAAFER